jgi:hypothetical protein
MVSLAEFRKNIFQGSDSFFDFGHLFLSIFQKSTLLPEKTLIFCTLTIMVTTFFRDFRVMVTNVFSHNGRSDRDRQRIVNKKHIF